MANTIVFYDTEFTSWKGAVQNNWSEPGQYREIVQIGALRFDLDTLETGAEFLILIKPRKNPVLSDYFIDLTGINNEAVAREGLDFAEGWQRFDAFLSGAVSACYGGDDFVMRENFGFNGMPDGPETFSSFNIGPWFKEEGARFGVEPTTNSGALAKSVGVEMEMDTIQEHNALHDARSIAAAYRFMVQNGVEGPFSG